MKPTSLPSRLVLAAACCTLAATPRAATAQRDTTAPRDTTARRVVFNEMFPGPFGVVALEEGAAYLVEVEPNQAVVTIRFARQPGRPPQILTPLTDRTTAAQGITYLLIARQTAEYRVEAFETGRDPVRVRIVYDPRETARWVRMREATAHLPRAGVGLRAAYIGPFGITSAQSANSARTSDGFGFEACLGVVARGAWAGGPIGGCVLALASYSRGDANGVVALGMAPHLVISRPGATTEVALAVSGWVATSTGDTEQNYWMLGFGLTGTRPLIGDRMLLEAAAGVRFIEEGTRGTLRSRSYTVPHIAVGLQVRP